MTAALEAFGRALDLFRLYIIMIPLMIGGYVMVFSGVTSFLDGGRLTSRISSSAAARVEGTVASKFEKAIPGRPVASYGVTVQPDNRDARKVTRWVERARWDTITVGQRWADPEAPKQLETSPATPRFDAFRQIGIGLLMLMVANYLRRKIRERKAEGNGAPSEPVSDLAKALREIAEKGAAAAARAKSKASKNAAKPTLASHKPASATTRPATTRPAATVVRQSTVRRAGWF